MNHICMIIDIWTRGMHFVRRRHFPRPLLLVYSIWSSRSLLVFWHLRPEAGICRRYRPACDLPTRTSVLFTTLRKMKKKNNRATILKRSARVPKNRMRWCEFLPTQRLLKTCIVRYIQETHLILDYHYPLVALLNEFKLYKLDFAMCMERQLRVLL